MVTINAILSQATVTRLQGIEEGMELGGIEEGMGVAKDGSGRKLKLRGGSSESE